MAGGTRRLYWEDDHCLDCEAEVIACADGAVALDRTCFYPGGGGQPCDEGTLAVAGLTWPVPSARAGDDGIVWHAVPGMTPEPVSGQIVKIEVNRARRLALTRYHTVLHILNTIALRDFGAWITGARIGTAYSRIDFKWDRFSPAHHRILDERVNAAIGADHPLTSSWLTEAEFQKRPDLLRTLEVRPPVIDGHVRVVTIGGFDAQACGGTHVRSTVELGRFSIVRSENKGRINKRLYVSLEA